MFRNHGLVHLAVGLQHQRNAVFEVLQIDNSLVDQREYLVGDQRRNVLVDQCQEMFIGNGIDAVFHLAQPKPSQANQ